MTILTASSRRIFLQNLFDSFIAQKYSTNMTSFGGEIGKFFKLSQIKKIKVGTGDFNDLKFLQNSKRLESKKFAY